MYKHKEEHKSPALRVEEMVARLRQGAHRITPQRLAILKVLAASDGHPSAEMIHKAMLANYPTMSLATVYKTLALLKQYGQVLELQFSELGNRYDGFKPYPHPHMICTECGAITDPPVQDIKEITEKMMNETGFRVVTHRLDFYGLCKQCQDGRDGG